MRITKAQAAVITLLNLLIAALLAVIFFYPMLGRSASAAPSGSDDPPETDVIGEPDPPPHEKYRKASDGKVSEILRETRLMGSGDESVVDVYFANGSTYIFGNATVGDLDFDGYGGFLCVLNGGGDIVKYTYFTGFVTAVGAVDGGFAVSALSGAGTADETAELYFAGFDGEAKSVARLTGGAVKIFAIDTKKTAVVTQPTPTSFKFTEYTVGERWTTGRSTVMDDNGCTLEFFDCYDFGESYVISARSYSPKIYDAAVFFSFIPGGDAAASRRGGGGEQAVRPYAVMPYMPLGYYVLCDIGGKAAVMCVEYSFVKYHVSMLDFSFSSARLLRADGKYYAAFERDVGAELYEIGSDFTCVKVSATDGIAMQAVSSGGAEIMAGKSAKKSGEASDECAFLLPSTGDILLLSVENAIVYDGKKTADGVTFVLSASGGEALTLPSGGRDIYVITIKV
ncbi:MAG: hypothetical protein NC184_04110 [Roseburia sp.]|nr:hypothetical protein [Roseburia sp.]